MNQFDSRRSPVYARHGMVATSQPLAAMAGLQILMAGGNAADAAVGTAAALNVTEPTSTGIGGDCFALYYDAKTRNITALNGSGRAPAGLTIDLVRQQNLVSPNDRISQPYHAHTITVPGACAGWCDMVARHGSMGMAQVLAPAIQLAEEGYPVAPVTAYYWARGAQRQLKNSKGAQELLIDGRAPRAGEIFRNPNLAKTFRLVAEGGRDAFYRGEIARAIAAVIQEHGGVMTTDDLARHESTWDEPICTSYREINIYECPPNGQGLAALMALNVLEGFDLRTLNPLGVERLHLMIEAMRVAFADTNWYVADPSFNRLPISELLSKDPYAKERRALIDRSRATLDVKRGSPVAGSDTVYLTVVDGKGNACSLINSNYMGFGTGIVPEGYGFSLQNRGLNFSLDPNHPNALAPRKRPYHTIIPAMATYANGSLYASFGVMGGFMQPQGHVQVAIALIDDGLDPQSALDRPRFCIVTGICAEGGRLALAADAANQRLV